ncbi:MAG TPA: hypothetical protein VLA15_02495 [Desulfurivibrionaceae bacterium]|nr:hypothetical protein [Desulfurivibrionaceae bacterium]
MGDIVDSIWGLVKEFFLFFEPVQDFFFATKVPEQIENIDYQALFSNPWFLVPYLALIGWNIYKRQPYSIIIILLFTGSWAFFGTPYMQGILSQEQIQLEAVLPLVGGACLVLAITIYLIFFKSE